MRTNDRARISLFAFECEIIRELTLFNRLMKEVLLERTPRKIIEQYAELFTGKFCCLLTTMAIQHSEAGVSAVIEELVFDHELCK